MDDVIYRRGWHGCRRISLNDEEERCIRYSNEPIVESLNLKM